MLAQRLLVMSLAGAVFSLLDEWIPTKHAGYTFEAMSCEGLRPLAVYAGGVSGHPCLECSESWAWGVVVV